MTHSSQKTDYWSDMKMIKAVNDLACIKIKSKSSLFEICKWNYFGIGLNDMNEEDDMQWLSALT